MYHVVEVREHNLVLSQDDTDGTLVTLARFEGYSVPASRDRIRAQACEMRDVLNEAIKAGTLQDPSSVSKRQNIFDQEQDEERLDGGSWKPATETSDDEAQDVVGQPLNLPAPGDGPREL